MDLNKIVSAHAASQVIAQPRNYRGWTIRHDPPPIPIRNMDWHATHPDYDASWEGEEDGWSDNGLKAFAPTLDALCAEIDAIESERDNDPNQT